MPIGSSVPNLIVLKYPNPHETPDHLPRVSAGAGRRHRDIRGDFGTEEDLSRARRPDGWSIRSAKRVDSTVISSGRGLRTRDRNMDKRRRRTECDSVRWGREAIWISTAGPEIPKAVARVERRPWRPARRPSPTCRKPRRIEAFGGETGVWTFEPSMGISWSGNGHAVLNRMMVS